MRYTIFMATSGVLTIGALGLSPPTLPSRAEENDTICCSKKIRKNAFYHAKQRKSFFLSNLHLSVVIICNNNSYNMHVYVIHFFLVFSLLDLIYSSLNLLYENV